MRNLAKVAIRILAVSFIAKSLFSIQNVIFFVYTLQQGQENLNIDNINNLFLFVPMIIWSLSGIALWYAAKPLSKIVIDKTDCDINFQIDNKSILKIAFIIIGMILIVFSVSDLISDIYNFIIVKDIRIASQLIGGIVRILIGIWLLFGSSGIIKIIKKFGRAGIYNSENKLNDSNE